MGTRDFNENSITDAVIARLAKTPDPRLKQIITSLVRHAHDFVRDVELTQDEWFQAILFLTEVGHRSDDKRQEFILLSDTLGISMLVDAINHRQPKGATETTVLGPFYVNDPPVMAHDASIFHGEGGTPFHVVAHVASADGKPLPGAKVDVWQSDDDGFYDVQRPGDDANLRARFIADGGGTVRFWTILPKYYPIPTDGPVGAMLTATKRHAYRPAHLHFMIAEPGYDTLVTHLFLEGDPYLDSDAVFGVKQSLIVDPKHNASGGPDGGSYRSLEHRFGLKPTGPGAPANEGRLK